MRNIQKESYKLNNGYSIPKIGFGTWQITGSEAYQSTMVALESGYVHIDTALAYGNEKEIGQAIKDSKCKREELFITSKLPAEIKGYSEAKNAFYQTIKNLDVDYLDLYLIHAPRPWNQMHDESIDYSKENLESWKAMEELYEMGLIKAIGVSNFSPKDIENIIQNGKIVPAVNQIYYHPGCPRYDVQGYCTSKGILIEAYSPFATGRIFKSEELKEIAKKYDVTVAQLAIAWCLERNTLPLPKSVHKDRIIKNIQVDFKISDEDLALIDKVKF